jgi:AcrR family transcriptional regulator
MPHSPIHPPFDTPAVEKPDAPQKRPGGRSARVVRAVIDAAIEVFAERGYGALSIEEVATRAGVNKTTVYRRWPTKAALVEAALVELRAETEVVPDTGTLKGDLLVVLEAKAALMATPRGRSVRRAILTGNDEPEIKAIVRAMRRDHPLVPRVVLTRAVERGELPKTVDLQLLNDALVGTLSSCTMWAEGVPRDLVHRLIDLVLDGARGPR